MIGVIDYGIGNVGSIINMLKKIGAEATTVKTVEEIERVDKLILPGVGAFDSGMKKLHQSGLVEAVKKHTLEDKKPILGICLGMQMLGTSSEEGVEPGLGFIDFECKKFEFDQDSPLKIPHMGWDIIARMDKSDVVLSDIEGTPRYYFVHSYYAECRNAQDILMTCDYGLEFAAAVHRENIYGFQFHPEKSHKFGMSILENYSKKV